VLFLDIENFAEILCNSVTGKMGAALESIVEGAGFGAGGVNNVGFMALSSDQSAGSTRCSCF
jgi:hypothetical protein